MGDFITDADTSHRMTGAPKESGDEREKERVVNDEGVPGAVHTAPKSTINEQGKGGGVASNNNNTDESELVGELRAKLAHETSKMQKLEEMIRATTASIIAEAQVEQEAREGKIVELENIVTDLQVSTRVRMAQLPVFEFSLSMMIARIHMHRYLLNRQNSGRYKSMDGGKGVVEVKDVVASNVECRHLHPLWRLQDLPPHGPVEAKAEVEIFRWNEHGTSVPSQIYDDSWLK